MSKLRPPDPGTFEQLLTLVPVPVAGIVRLSISGRTEPFWSRSARYRFDDPSAGPGSARYGTLYRLSQRWAKAIHDARPEADGLKYQSRQFPGEVCYAIFDRSGLKASRWRSLTDDEKIELCDLFNVVPV